MKWKETGSICKIFIFWQGLHSEPLVVCKQLLSTYSQIRGWAIGTQRRNYLQIRFSDNKKKMF